MSRVRPGTVLALAGIMGGSAWWLCWVPYQPERMLHGIPREAVAVAVHHDVAGRQETLLGNPVVRFLIAPSATSDAETDAVVSDPTFQSQLRRFGSGELVAAYLPAFGPLSMDTYVFSSWLGGRSHWLRWAMLLGNSGMRRERLPGGRVYWITETDLKDSEGRTLRFSLTFEEGLGLGCLSVDPHNIRMVIGCYDRNLPSVLTPEPRLTEWLMQSHARDRGWVSAPGLQPFRYLITDIQPDRLSAIVRCEGDWTGVNPGARLALPAMFGALPFASATLSRGFLARSGGADARVGDVTTLLDELGAHGVGVSVFGGEYGGRLRGIRVPAVVLAAPCDDGPEGTALMYRIVHRLGLREGVDLTLTPAPDGEPRIYSLGTPGESFYGNLPDAERGAFCVADDWLLLASNRVTLQRLLERREWTDGALGGGGAEDDALWMSVDLARGEKSLRNALAMYRLVQLLDGAGDSTTRGWLDAARSLATQAAALGRMEVRARAENDELILTLEMGQ